MTIERRAIAAAVLAVLLAGCEHGFNEATNPASSFGEANRQTYLAQTVDPDPQYDEPLATSADHAAQAVDRYRKDAVKQPERTDSTSASGGGGGN